MIKAGIIGSTGYAGGELARLLLQREDVEIKWYGKGVIDCPDLPLNVSRSALQNATSVASTLLTTESAVAIIKEDTPAPAANPGMGMM